MHGRVRGCRRTAVSGATSRPFFSAARAVIFPIGPIRNEIEEGTP